MTFYTMQLKTSFSTHKSSTFISILFIMPNLSPTHLNMINTIIEGKIYKNTQHKLTISKNQNFQVNRHNVTVIHCNMNIFFAKLHGK